MKTPSVVHIASRDNPLFKNLRRLIHEPNAYRKQGKIWLEGDHLCRAALERGVQPEAAVFSRGLWEQGVAQGWHAGLRRVHVLEDALFGQLSPLESAAQMGYVLDAAAMLQHRGNVDATANTVILDRIQDAGNVGSILRSASALGFKQVLALQGTAALWSPKVLRAGMGAHFGLYLFEGCTLHDVDHLRVPLLVTHLQGSDLLHRVTLPTPSAWVFGHEGQGVDSDLVQRAAQLVRIDQPGGEESLNVAAAAAICLHASATSQSCQASRV
ncbi:MAG: RNA methyltransferase [Brachymonas sp.]|nr:RNA methyltransferase [Brachymonas sp.]MBP8820560.1 RNA methyltransferase [Brachymonas sp.]MBP9651838.1 RNA methyltransferase [Brachymonas sp.]